MKYVKAILAAIGLVAATLTAALADDVLDVTEVQAIAAALIEAALTIAAVWGVPNARFLDLDTLSLANKRRLTDMLLQQNRLHVPEPAARQNGKTSWAVAQGDEPAVTQTLTGEPDRNL